MSKERLFPTMVSYFREEEYCRVARLMVRDYTKFVYPILFRFRLWDDEHIKKYLSSKTAEDIYKDAMQEKKERMLFLEQEAEFHDEDLWMMIRDESSPVKSPKEEGFVFKKMPHSEYNSREIVVKSLYVENREIQINEDIIQKESIIIPTEKQRELYNILSDFCDELDKCGYSKRNACELFINSRNGKVTPNIHLVLNNLMCYKLNK